jgi:hypothetical protein
MWIRKVCSSGLEVVACGDGTGDFLNSSSIVIQQKTARFRFALELQPADQYRLPAHASEC